MQIIDGKLISQQIKEELKQEVANLIQQNIIPTLHIIQVGDNASSNIYIRNKIRLSDELKTKTVLHKLNNSINEDQLIDLIHQLNNDDSVNGILVQLPLPKNINEEHIINQISPLKDVDGFTLHNVGIN